jgi:hypothetical protein
MAGKKKSWRGGERRNKYSEDFQKSCEVIKSNEEALTEGLV